MTTANLLLTMLTLSLWAWLFAHLWHLAAKLTSTDQARIDALQLARHYRGYRYHVYYGAWRRRVERKAGHLASWRVVAR